jgi:transposase InsO family protein
MTWCICTTPPKKLCSQSAEAGAEIWNSSQGSQFHLDGFSGAAETTQYLDQHTGRGRALDNAFIERLWRSLKYELIYPEEFDGRAELGFRFLGKADDDYVLIGPLQTEILEVQDSINANLRHYFLLVVNRIN